MDMSMKNLPSTDFSEELARGDARTALKDAGATRASAFNLDIDEIMVLDGFNPRVAGTEDYEVHIDELASSILANGFLPGKPLTVHPVSEKADGSDETITVFYVVDGHSRLEAARRANKQGAEIKTLPVVLTPEGTSLADLTVQTVLNNNSTKPLSPVEVAVVVKRLLGYNMAKADIAKRLGITTRYVEDLLVLLGAPASIMEAVRSGKMAATLAIQEIKAHGAKASERVKEALAKAGGKKVTAKALPKAPTAKAKTESGKAKAKEKAKNAVEKAKKTSKPAAAEKPAKVEPRPVGVATDVDFWKGAIEHALSMPKKDNSGLTFLAQFVAEDAATITEVERWLGQPAGAFFDKTLRTEIDKGDL